MGSIKVLIYGILALLSLYSFGYVSAKNSYIFIAPNVVRPGREFSIQGELLELPSAPVLLVAELTDGNKQVARTEVTVNSKQGVNLDLSVPIGFKAASKTLSLTITGSGGLSFKSSKTVDFEDKSVTVYIQTDKSVYKPGQTIRMRVFGTTPELSIINDKLQVELHDPKGNKINQWDVSGTEMNNLNNVYVTQQVLSEYPILGEWKIKAKLLSHGTLFTEKVVKVEEYVLPKFEVEFDLPSFGRTKDTIFEGKVKAKYTFGKPVKGEASLLVQPKNKRFSWIAGAQVDVSKKFNLKFPINGEAKFRIPMSDLTNISPLNSLHSGQTLIFKVNVTETLTKAKQSDDQEVSFYTNPIKIEFPKSLPDTFKPSMKYTVVVKVSLQDGMPPDVSHEKLSAIIKEYSRVSRERRCQPRRWGRRCIGMESWTEEKITKTTTRNLDVPLDGIVSFTLNPKTKNSRIEIEAKYRDARDSLNLKKRHSPSDSFIQITTTNSSPQAGQTVQFDVRSTRVPGKVHYQIYSKGLMTKAGTFSMNSKTKRWTLPVTSSMAPRARIIVYYIHTGGEVVADALTVNVQGIFKNKVSVGFNNTMSRPGDKIELNIAADANSIVNVLAVDKSVLLLGTGNDVTSDQVIGEVNKFNTKSKKRSGNGFCDWFCWRWPMPSGGQDVKDVFDEAGVIVMTDANVYEHKEVIEQFPRPMPWMRGGRGRMDMQPMFMQRSRMRRPSRIFAKQAMAVKPVSLPSSLPSSSSVLAPVQKVRKLFPETWLWAVATVPENGTQVTIKETVPDTITSWIATAFAVHPQSGLGLSQAPAQLQVSLPFFMIVTLPYSVVRGEKVIIQVNLHNYSPEPLFTRVELSQSTDFENIQIDGNRQTRTSMNVARAITVAPNEVAAIYFPIVPVTIGRIDINLKAQTPMMADAVVKKLLVEAEGTPREQNFPVLIDLGANGTYTETVKIEFPPRTVVGSERITATVIGDIMGPSLSGLDKLLKMPSGCGEQNMLKFAPNIFIVKYLNATRNLDEKTLTTAQEFMEKGYQRELTYSHPDGSYSAFGSSDSSGSTWLTAFVTKSFVQAKPYTFIDDDVVVKAVKWLIKQQNKDGTFAEPGRVIHKEMQGGSTAGKVSLTSFVLISLLEARVIEGVSMAIQAAADKSQAYLEGQIATLEDVYDLAIVTYALQLADSVKVQEVLDKLNLKAVDTPGGMKHWEKESSAAPGSSKKGKAVNIELTAYALLSLAERKDRIEGVKVLKWLTKQRNSDGGFMSTQDTVVALHGLAEMAALLYRPVTNLDVTINGTGFVETLQIDNTNALVLQRRNLPSNKGDVTVTGTGQGFGLVQIGVFYNVDSDGQKESFMLKVMLISQTINMFEVEACASWLDTGSSSMAVMEIGSPSGFVPDPALVISEPKHKKKEIEERKIVLYFDEITSVDTCVRVTMQRIGMVAGAMPVAVRVYDYYEPGKQVTEFYIPDAIKNSDVCDICGPACDFCFNNPL